MPEMFNAVLTSEIIIDSRKKKTKTDKYVRAYHIAKVSNGRGHNR